MNTAVLVQAMEIYSGDGVYPQPFLNWRYIEESSEFHISAALPPRKESGMPIKEKAGWNEV